MVKYKVNLKFKENGKSLNEIITNALKMELEKHDYVTYKNFKIKLPLEATHYSQGERNIN